jgi:hypothetical protein
VFWSEITSVTEMDMKRLDIWERKTLRRTFGPLVEKAIWKI